MIGSHVRSPSTNALKISLRIPTALTSHGVISKQQKSNKLTRPLHQLSPSNTHLPSPSVAGRHLSDLGLRSQRPPDRLPESDESSQPPEVGDQEWEIRTGRALYVIQETLPEFFLSGLITSVNKATGAPSRSTSTFATTPSINFLEFHTLGDDEEPIYSPKIQMQYTPPSELPPPFPKTFHIEGLQLYVTSSGIVRHTMNALYSDLSLKTTKLIIKSPPQLPSSSEGKRRRINRDKSFVVRQIVNGVARVSGKPAEWEIESTYTFSPTSGLIYKHIVDSIQPAPHVAVYDSLRLSLGKLLGWASSPGATSNGAVCKGDHPTPHT
ncbi:hypothetical protein CPB83DRAFT_761481 [Crepidotus variabilis]|uniref:Uncharacterized protein n=1 Tax=Crepidotus variabilis TaxID=179855 RepID=A0A9P6EKD0_9AGAR|nr:hypothetical protein CPB83DRAFT_761481 [Crepidotus variabilis]